MSAMKTQFPDHAPAHVNPTEVDNLLSKELLKLDFKERNVLIEEAHGVNCISVVETPEMIAKALCGLADAIDQIPAHAKQAYLRSLQTKDSHVQTKSFRLRFLRCTNFDIPISARRIVEFLEIGVDLFGEIVLQRPFRLSDFSKKELQLLRLGRLQFMQFGDRIGRRILIFLLDETWESFPPRTKAKITMYMSWVAGEDIMTQKKGIVIIVWFDKESLKGTSSPHPKNVKYREIQLHSNRAAAIHICTPDTPFYRFRRAVATLRLGRSRKFLRTHLGNSIENRYALQGYGIPVDQLPISYSGKIKLGYVRQWIGVRRANEAFRDNPNPQPSSDSQQAALPNNIIEYPQPEDVVFRQGSSCTSHPANLAFRNLIMAKVLEQEQSREVAGGTKIRRKKMVLDIISEIRIKNGGRFLLWNDNGGWNEMNEEELIHSKIEYLIKEFRKTARTDSKNLKQQQQQKQKQQIVLDGGTSIFRSNHYGALPTTFGLPLNLTQQVDEKDMVEAACCVAQCFDMTDGPPQKL